MTRTISDIRREIAAAYIADPTIQHAYKLTAGKTFEEQFSKVSLESILFWTFASAVWTLETLFDKHRTEVAQLVSEAEPHTLRWYAQRAKAYLHGHALPPYKDRYDLSSISPEEQERAAVVRYAVASEYQGVVHIKVAGADKDKKPTALPTATLTALTRYLEVIKDAGVQLRISSATGDELRLTLTIYLTPSLLINGKPSEDFDKHIRQTITSNVADLPFDGVFRPADLVIALSKLSGVEASEVTYAAARPSSYDSFTPFTGYHRPSAGYFLLSDLTLNYKPYEPYTDR